MTQSIFNFDDILDNEEYYGNIEYKRELINLDADTLNKRITQMKYRVYEGSGEAIYLIGVCDDGSIVGLNETEYAESISNLTKIANSNDCSIIKISEYNKNNNYVGEFLIRENDKVDIININIGVAGNVDSGKSTTVGTLAKGILDDGRGKARLNVFNFKHEVESGRTSSIGHQIMGFDKEGEVIKLKLDKNNSWVDITSRSSKIISFYDLAGHEKYLKTTIHGLSSLYPDYCLIMISANMGINHMTREHIGICINLKIPFIIIVTKVDSVPDNILQDTLKVINNMCKNRIRKIPYHIKNKSDIINVIKNIKSDSIVPIIQISNVTNHNLDLVKTMLNLLPVRHTFSQNSEKSVELIIDNTYYVPGHPIIVSGMLKSGTVNVNDSLLLGPFKDSTYKSVKVRSIHLNFKDLKQVKSGSYICISLKNITRKEIKKGMIVVSDNTKLKLAVKQFIIQIHILHSPTTIKEGYEPFVHIEHVRQTVRMLEITKDDLTEDLVANKLLRCGDKANVKLEFVSRPEYIKVGMRMVFREGRVKAVGKIIEIL